MSIVNNRKTEKGVIMVTQNKEANRLTLTADETFIQLGVSRPFGFRLLREGQLPFARRLGKRWVIGRAALEEWLAKSNQG